MKSIPKFNFLSQKMAVLSPVIFNKDYIAKNSKIGIFSPKMNFSKNKKMRFFLMFQGSLDQKIRFLGQKVSSVARRQTHRHTDTHECEYRGHPFRVSGILSFNLSSRSGPIYIHQK